MVARSQDCRNGSILRWVALSLALGVGGASAAPPNIVLIYVDDLGWQDVGFNGAKFYETPNIDRLAKQGMNFTHAYAAGPSCVPSRASLLSGMYTPRHHSYLAGRRSKINPHRMKLWTPVHERFWKRIGVTDPVPDAFEVRASLKPGVSTIAEMLASGGYVTARFGKWHVGRDKQGFRYSSSNGKPNEESNHYDDPDVTFHLTTRSVKFIKAHHNRPFFLYLSHWDVHNPFVARADLVKKYRRKLASWPGQEELYRPVYAAMIEAVDSSVGRIVRVLENYGLVENTLVIFTSDNGPPPTATPHPFRGAKTSLYEGGIRVPTCMRWPGVIAPGSTSSTPITQVDFLPTFAELAGIRWNVDQPVDGTSFASLLKGERIPALADRAIFWHFPLYVSNRGVPSSAIRKGDWKLIEFFEDKQLELYNIPSDPGESSNRAASMPDKARELHEELIAWRNATNAPVPQQSNPYYQGDSGTGPDPDAPEQIRTRLSQAEEQIRSLQVTVQSLDGNRERLRRLVGRLRDAEERDKALQSIEDNIRNSASAIVAQ